MMSAAGSASDGALPAEKGGVLARNDCKVLCEPGTGQRWSVTLKNGTTWHCRCDACNVFNKRLNKVLKQQPMKKQWQAFSTEQKKEFRNENKDKFSDDLATAMTTMSEQVGNHVKTIR